MPNQNADIAGAGTVFEGRYFGKQLYMQGGSQMDDGGGGAPPAPEPLTMLGMFLGLGSIGGYLRSRRMK